MNDEAEIRSAGAPDRGRSPRGSTGQQSPLQARAAFIKNWDWQSVIRLNRGACERGGAQHGVNSETGRACETEWEAKRSATLTLAQTVDFLRQCHRRAPFLFFNGNTFADVGRRIATALFAELPPVRLREVVSAVAHYIAGVLPREDMVAIVESLSESAELRPGDRVRTLRGSLRGAVKRVLADGKVAWLPDDGGAELTALPESLVREDKS
jgi:hypothetical protein